MSAEREQMVATLKEIVVPVLKDRGFKGSFPHFRRPTDTAIHLLTFQFDKWGGGFVIEIGSCAPSGITTPWGNQIPPNKVTAHDISHTDRHRLGAPAPNRDHWFRYDRPDLPADDSRYTIVAHEFLPLLDTEAEPYWNHH